MLDHIILGFLLWAELLAGINTLSLFFEALQHNIAIAPGCLFSARPLPELFAPERRFALEHGG